MAEKYYNISPYAYCAGNPIKYIAPDGRKVYLSPESSDEFQQRFKEVVRFMNEKGTSFNLAKLEESSTIYYIREGKINSFSFSSDNNDANIITWNPYQAIMTDNDLLMSPATTLAHELGHAASFDKDKNTYIKRRREKDNEYDNTEEKRVITKTEQFAAHAHGELMPYQTTRENHRGDMINFSHSLSLDTIIKWIRNHNASVIE